MHYLPLNRERVDFERPYVWEDDDGNINEQLRDHLIENREFIHADHQVGSVMTRLNFAITARVGEDRWFLEIIRLIEMLRNMSFHNSIRFNMSLGFTLVDSQSGRYRYFLPHHNTPYFEQPRFIRNHNDWDDILHALTFESLITNIIHHRENSRWKPILVTNVQFYLYFTDVVMGNATVLPDNIRNHRCIVSLVNDRQGRPYADNACALRCLAYHLNSKANKYDDASLREALETLKERWPQESLGMNEVSAFKHAFDINVDIYCLNSDNSVSPKYMSKRQNGDDILTLNLHNDHLSYVSNREGYLGLYRCHCCQKTFTQLSNLKKHFGTCANATLHKFPGGFHTATLTIFDELEEYGIQVPDDARFYPWFAVFDCEAILSPCDEGSTRLRFSREHKVISVSIASNVPGYTEAKCFVDFDSRQLITNMITYLEKIQCCAYDLAVKRWSLAYSKLNDKIKYWKDIAKMESCSIGNEHAVEKSWQGETSVASKGRHTLIRLKAIKHKFRGYLKQLPVIGFNSARYDLNLMKSDLIPYLKMQIERENKRKAELRKERENNRQRFGDGEGDYGVELEVDIDNKFQAEKHLDIETEDSLGVIKKCNSYACIMTEKLRFLDIQSFVAPGINYALFLKAYGVEEQKSFFPYEYLDCKEKLQEDSLPPYEAFYSELKGKNVLDENGGEKLGRENYAKLQRLWVDSNMESLCDFLMYYNNQDTYPFVKAVMTMQTFYFERAIDLFKIAISVPGIARSWLYKEAKQQNAYFSLIAEEDDDFHHTLKQNLVGGYSGIFTRKHVVDETRLQHADGEICQNIVGYDANSLYLRCIGQDMPCGGYVRRLAPHFTPSTHFKCESMFEWMDYISSKENIRILHARNHREVRIGGYLVDGKN